MDLVNSRLLILASRIPPGWLVMLLGLCGFSGVHFRSRCQSSGALLGVSARGTEAIDKIQGLQMIPWRQETLNKSGRSWETTGTTGEGRHREARFAQARMN